MCYFEITRLERYPLNFPLRPIIQCFCTDGNKFFFLFFSFSSTHVGKPNTIPLSLFLIFPVFLSLYSASSLKPRAEEAKGKWRELNASLMLLQHGEKRKREGGDFPRAS